MRIGLHRPKRTQMYESICQGFRNIRQNWFSFIFQVVATGFLKVIFQFEQVAAKCKCSSNIISLLTVLVLPFSEEDFLCSLRKKSFYQCQNLFFGSLVPEGGLLSRIPLAWRKQPKSMQVPKSCSLLTLFRGAFLCSLIKKGIILPVQKSCHF